MSYFEHDDALRSMIRRARLLKVDDSDPQQFVDLMVLANEKPKKVFRPQDHGFTSNPPQNSEGIVVALGGRSDRVLYLDGGHKDHRPRDLPSGAVALYDADGKVLKIVKDSTDWDGGSKPWTLHNVTTITIHGSGKIVIQSDAQVVVKAPRVDLGDEGGAAVETASGPSSIVFAKV